jgi:DNA repair protein RecN (Recombination protein N)
VLSELRIQNYAVIEDLSLRLEPGLAALTGETGAGKSIIVGALSLVLGERATADVIRAGEERAVVEAAFDVKDRPDLLRRCDGAGIDVGEGWLVLKREVNTGGRSRAWINGTPATASLTGELGRAGAADHAGEVADLHARLSETQRRRVGLEERQARTQERAELLRHQADEIEDAGLREANEDLILADEERRQAHAEELLERASNLHDEIYSTDEAIYERLGRLRRELDALSNIDPRASEEMAELFDTVYYTLQELGERLGSYRDSIDLDPSKLEQTRQRIDALYRLKAKYGPTLDDVMAAGEHARAELDALDLAGFELDELAKQEAEISAKLEKAAARLGRARSKAAKALAVEVSQMLPELGMPEGQFEVALPKRSSIASTGAEDVEYRVTLNKGFEPQPLSRVASGGELSRVMLALKTILARLDRTPTLVFDEIDAGIGGIVGQKIAERLRVVADHHQVFVITHLPQIAALADHHLLVTKGSSGRRTATEVSELSGEGRVRDLARMLGGDPEREESIEHARALLELS